MAKNAVENDSKPIKPKLTLGNGCFYPLALVGNWRGSYELLKEVGEGRVKRNKLL